MPPVGDPRPLKIAGTEVDDGGAIATEEFKE